MRRILVLHRISSTSRLTTVTHAFALPQYCPDNLYVYHHINAPVTEALKSICFDGVILNYCFLSYIRSDNLDYREVYAFLKDIQCCKIALCQDDYTRNEILDNWLFEIGITNIFSPIEKHLNILYPKCFAAGKKFHMGLTGYVSSAQELIYHSSYTDWNKRTIDVGTRVRKLPAYYGRHGVNKGKIIEPVSEFFQKAGFVVDMSTDPRDVITAGNWLKFMGNCKFTLGSKGGASLTDPTGSIRKCVDEYLNRYPDAPFEDIEAHCFAGLDMKYDFSAISPRLFESASLDVCQILTREEWPGGMVEYEDYIPLESDLSNIDEVISIMRDDDHCQKITANCRVKLIDSGLFDYSKFAASILALIPENKNTFSSDELDQLNAHFSVLEPFTKLRSIDGGALVAVFCRYLHLNARAGQIDLACELIASDPTNFESTWKAALSGSLPPSNLQYLAGISEICKLICDHDIRLIECARKIADNCLGGELSSINLSTWDLCEVLKIESK